MAQQSLYRRYRPRRFGEVRGQDHVITAIRNAVANGTEAHAYMFSGPRGTGKTSTARILAKALNCINPTDGEPCCECEPCIAMEAGSSFDLFELDAASNNGVDSIRDLVERSAIGSPGRTKVYILDEVHMLTAAASNALLKTLEEPPDHVVFVLATTDPQKVLPTIKSRTQHFKFQLLSASELESYVRWIAEDADLEFTDDEVSHAVREGKGSARDTLTELDQIVAAGGVSTRTEPVEDLFEALKAESSARAIKAVSEALQQGHDPRVLAEAFLGSVRNAFLRSLGVELAHMVDSELVEADLWAESLGTKRLAQAMESVGVALVDMRQAADPRIPLEVALIRLTTPMDTGQSVAPAQAAQAPATVAEGSSNDGVDELSRKLHLLAKKVDALEAGASKARPAAAPPVPPRRKKSVPTDAGMAEKETVAPAAAPSIDTESPKVAATSKEAAPAQESESPITHASKPQEPEAQKPGAPKEPLIESDSGDAAASADQEAMPSKEQAEPSEPADSEGGGAGSLPDRDALVMAFGDVIADRLSGIAKAIYSGGRFVAVTPNAALFAVENEPTIEKAERYRPEVEKLLNEHFGFAVPIQLITEADAPDADGGNVRKSTAPRSSQQSSPSASPQVSRRDAGGSPPAAEPESAPAGNTKKARKLPATPKPRDVQPITAEAQTASTATADAGSQTDSEPEEVVDMSALRDADDVAQTEVDRLTEAFPGSRIIQKDEGQPQ